MKNTEITLRLANMEDAEELLAWRNDFLTRDGSHTTTAIRLDEHVNWLSATLKNPSRQLFIAMDFGKPVGTVRSDCTDLICELSWTVSPQARGHGVAKNMVALLAKQISTAIRAEVKKTNVASIKVAEFAGMHLEYEENGVLHFKRSAVI